MNNWYEIWDLYMDRYGLYVGTAWNQTELHVAHKPWVGQTWCKYTLHCATV